MGLLSGSAVPGPLLLLVRAWAPRNHIVVRAGTMTARGAVMCPRKVLG